MAYFCGQATGTYRTNITFNVHYFYAQAPGEKKKKNLFGKKLSFTKGKDKMGSEDTLSGEDCEFIAICLKSHVDCLMERAYGP